MKKKSTFTFETERPILGNLIKTNVVMEYRTVVTIGVDLNKKFNVTIRKKAFNQNDKNQIIIKVNYPEIFKIHLQLIDVKNQTYFREIWGDEVIKVHKYVQHLVAEKSKTEDMEEAKKSIEANFYDIYRPILNYTNENYEVIVKYEY